jgi:hypothetical protein
LKFVDARLSISESLFNFSSVDISSKFPSCRSLIESLNLNESLVFDQTGCSSKETCFISFCAFACVCEKKTKIVDTKSDAHKHFLIKAFSAKNLFLLIPTEYGF